MRERRYQKAKESLYCEMAYAVLMIIIITLFVSINRNETCDYPIAMWLTVAMASYTGDFILLMM